MIDIPSPEMRHFMLYQLGAFAWAVCAAFSRLCETVTEGHTRDIRDIP